MEEIDNEITFNEHCDHEYCDLGAAEFYCPWCKKHNRNYGDMWWERDNVNLTHIEDECYHCKKTNNCGKRHR